MSALKVVKKYGYELLNCFVKDRVSGKMIAIAKTFLLQCNKSTEIKIFDDLPFRIFHKKQTQFNIEKMPQL